MIRTHPMRYLKNFRACLPACKTWRLASRILPCSQLRKVSGATRHEKPALALSLEGHEEKIKPYTAIPSRNRHWLMNVLEILLTKGGIQKSLFKIQEETLRKYGPIYRHANVTGEEIWLFDPVDVAAVFRAEPKYPKRFDVPVFDYFYKQRSKEPGVFFLNGEKWQKHKRIMSRKMLRPPDINQYIPKINDIASEMVERISKIRNNAKEENWHEVNELDMELFKWSFETVAGFLFDRRFGCLTDNPPEKSVEFIRAIGCFLENALPANLLPAKLYKYYQTKAFKKFDENFLKMYHFVDELIEEKLDQVKERLDRGEKIEDSNELIPFLLSTGMISEEEVSSSIVDTLFAGVDTTSNTMLWMLYLLAKNPDIQTRIRDEVQRVLPGDTQPDSSSLQHLPLVRASVKETLRLNPLLVATGRFLEQDVVLSGYHVPAKTSLILMHYAMGRREEIFENAREFIPERWLGQKGSNKIDAFASIPFGHGTRMCLGRRLAEMELQILLAKILKRFTLNVPQNHLVEPKFRGVVIPDKPIRVKFTEV